MSIEVNATEQLITVNATDTSIDVNVTSQVVDVNATTSVIEVDVSNGPGPQGPQGPAGQGVPVGGTTGQVLAKNSATNYDTEWVDVGAGTVTSVNASGSVGISVTGGPITSSGTFVITNTAPDQVVALTGAGTATITGTYPNFTITANDQYTGTVTSVNLTAGTGISVSGGPVTSSGSINVVNTAPDQVVSLTGGGTTTISGTYPNFTITSADQYSGTVTSVNMTVPTGFTISGNPITSAGTLALAMASGYAIPTTASQANWDSAYNDKINSAAVTGTTTKTLTLTQQDGGTITASWSDYDTAPVTSVFGRTGDVVAANGDYNTSQVTENTNLYFTNARARQSISETITGIDYDNTTGVFSQTAGYSIPTTASQSTWDSAYNDKINSASVTGTGTKTLTLNQQDGGTITASWTDIDTGLTSVGVSMPSAFNVANSPLTANGTISVTGAGSVLQYIDGTGALQTFPTGLPPTGQAGGDLTGTYPNPTVHRIHGIDLQNGTPTADDVWIYGGSPAKWQHQKLHTNQITEDTNLFYTDARARAAISETITGIDYSSTTGVFSITSGYGIPTTASQSNWDAAYNDKINSASVTGTTTKTLTLTQQDGGTVTASWSDYDTAPVTSVFGRTGVVTAQSGDYTTTQVTEGTNLYYTDVRVSANSDVAANTAARHSAVTLGTANGLSLSTQQLSLGLSSSTTTGALSSTDWTTFNSKQAALNGTGFVKISGTTISYDNSTYYLASNPNSYIAKTDLSAVTPLSYSNVTGVFQMSQANTSTSGYLTSTDWNTFNNKQSALTNPVTGTGTSGQVAYFNGTTSITSESNLFWDATNDRLGIGTSTPSRTFQVNGYISSFDGTTNTEIISSGGIGYFGTSTNHPLVFQTNNSERMRLTSTGLGIGTSSPSQKLHVYDGIARFDNVGAQLILGTSGVAGSYTFSVTTGNDLVVSLTGVAERMRLSSSGNLGLGVTPSAWGAITALELGNGISFGSYTAAAIPNSYLTNNAYYNGSNWIYKVSSYAATMQTQTSGGAYAWNTAPSGTAGNAISFTQAMTLNASGNLSIGNTNDTYKLDVSGTGRFSASQVDILLNASSTSQYSRLIFQENGTEKGGMEYINSAFGTTARRNKLEIFNAGGINFITQGNFTSPDLSLASTGAATFSSSVTANGNGAFNTTSAVSGYALDVRGATNKRFGVLNSNSLSGASVLFYTDANAFADGYIDATKLILQSQSGGNLGIGTTSPTRSVHILGQTGIGTVLKLEGASGTTTYLQLSYNGATDAQSGYIGYDSSANMPFFTNNTERLRITSGGNVGIGTTSPNTIFSVAKTETLNAFTDYVQLSDNTNGLRFSNYFYSGGIRWDIRRGTTTMMSFDPSNNVGIGTTSPSVKLEVNGQIKTAAPTGYSAQPWKLGDATSGTLTPNYYIKVEINGQIYSIPALQGTP